MKTTGHRGYLRVHAAAALLGIKPAALRRWDKVGLLKAKRDPKNGWRLYSRASLLAMKPIADGEWLTVSEAALILGVSLPTMRRWDASGRFEAERHPFNGYRMYRRSKTNAMKIALRRER